VKPYVLRYWETEFRLVRPQKSRTGQRLYQRKDIEVLLQIKQLLYDEKYTISGAKKRLKLLRGPGERQLDLAFGADSPAVPVEEEPAVEPGPEPEEAPAAAVASEPATLSADLLERASREVEAILELVRKDKPVR